MPEHTRIDDIRERQERARAAAAQELDDENTAHLARVEINACGLCDDDGYRGTRVCDHREHSTPQGRVGPGLTLRLPIVGVIDLEPDDALGAELSRVCMDIDLLDGILQATRVEVIAREGRPVTGTLLRQIPVKGMASDLIQMVALVERKTADGSTKVSVGLNVPDESERARLRRQGPVEESLRVVANFYEFGRVTGCQPAKFVEDVLDMPRTTVSKWIRRAREEGFLDVPET
jgi:hypothetical protein